MTMAVCVQSFRSCHIVTKRPHESVMPSPLLHRATSSSSQIETRNIPAKPVFYDMSM